MSIMKVVAVILDYIVAVVTIISDHHVQSVGKLWKNGEGIES